MTGNVRRGKAFRRAVDALQQLGPDAWEHRLLAILLHWCCELIEQPTLSEEDKEFMDATPSAFERMQARAREEGLSQGLLPRVHLFERRLSHALTAEERAALIDRFNGIGPARLGDVVLELSPDGLAAWLPAPDAR